MKLVVIVFSLIVSSLDFVFGNGSEENIIYENNCEIIDIPIFPKASNIQWKFEPFDLNINLNLELNHDLTDNKNNCHYMHQDADVTAAISYCNKQMVSFVIVYN